MADLNEVSRTASALIAEHLDASWSFGFDRARTRGGACHWSKRRITVSSILAARWEFDEVHQVLLHEVAHAVAGPRAGHGKKWLTVARSLGYRGGATHRNEVASELASWIGECPAGHVIYRYRRPDAKLRSCSRCAPRFDERFIVSWRPRTAADDLRREAAS